MARYVLTDQEYVSRVLFANLAANSSTGTENKSSSKNKRKAQVKKKHHGDERPGDEKDERNIVFVPLDWERDIPDSSLAATEDSGKEGLDAVIACDCIYNEALVAPFVQTCVDVCLLRAAAAVGQPTVCVVAQQLRDPEVFGEWLRVFGREFRVWRVPEDLLGEELGEGSGFVVHVGILKRGEGADHR